MEDEDKKQPFDDGLIEVVTKGPPEPGPPLEERYRGWWADPEKAKLYLLEKCKLNPDHYYGFYFEDGTGYSGKPLEFIPYLIRRFAAFPDDSFEIDHYEMDPDEMAGRELPSGELYPLTEEDEVWDPSRKDPRF